MAVHVEALQRTGMGVLYSVAHYYEAKGDLVPAPISFKNSMVFNQPVRWLHDGEIVVDAGQQASLVSFANTFLRNIAAQRGIGGGR